MRKHEKSEEIKVLLPGGTQREAGVRRGGEVGSEVIPWTRPHVVKVHVRRAGVETNGVSVCGGGREGVGTHR